MKRLVKTWVGHSKGRPLHTCILIKAWISPGPPGALEKETIAPTASLPATGTKNAPDTQSLPDSPICSRRPMPAPYKRILRGPHTASPTSPNGLWSQSALANHWCGVVRLTAKPAPIPASRSRSLPFPYQSSDFIATCSVDTPGNP